MFNHPKVINAGDALEFLSGGFYRATIHRYDWLSTTRFISHLQCSPFRRVVQPPADQQNQTRLGVFYFCTADDDTKLVPFAESPVLERIGITRRFDDKDAPTMEIWRKGRTTAYGQSDLKPAAENGVEEEVMNGVVVKHWN